MARRAVGCTLKFAVAATSAAAAAQRSAWAVYDL
jgi:hypothetical protein